MKADTSITIITIMTIANVLWTCTYFYMSHVSKKHINKAAEAIALVDDATNPLLQYCLTKIHNDYMATEEYEKAADCKRLLNDLETKNKSLKS